MAQSDKSNKLRTSYATRMNCVNCAKHYAVLTYIYIAIRKNRSAMNTAPQFSNVFIFAKLNG